METTYTTVKKRGYAELEEKKSTFIGLAARVESAEEAAEFLKTVKKKYPDARHHVYAYLLRGGNVARYSDDGEPQGTGGLPVLELLKKSGVEDVIVVVVRYFGGILLGTGGLTRAYSEAGKLALENAETVTYRPYTELSFLCSYREYQRYLALLPSFSAITDDVVYGEYVTLRLALPKENTERFISKVTEESAGKTTVEIDGERFDA